MGKYSVALSVKAKEQLLVVKKLGNKGAMKKIEKLIDELSEHPQSGTGKPEQLKGVEGIWARRVDKKNRLLYTIKEEKILVLVLSVLGHYEDK
ncbi:MAG: Txe/YoeB family addiction module toxin [Porphyromonas sp.]|nr:Txe/YoeB family addiction module toxin [Porphyromonas sp.]